AAPTRVGPERVGHHVCCQVCQRRLAETTGSIYICCGTLGGRWARRSAATAARLPLSEKIKYT
ncbi:hypothetical protein TNIN_352121, partial [Trichonephila inaurata madagascariensis]